VELRTDVGTKDLREATEAAILFSLLDGRGPFQQ